MLKSELKEIITDQNRAKEKQGLIERDSLHKIEQSLKNPFVTIISGVRRCGKSTLMKELKKRHSGYYLNFDDDRLVRFGIEDFQLLYELFIELYGEKDIYYFDEIQNIQGWERFARRLHDQDKKIFIIGSNATMLSKELGTHLTGRYIQMNLFPFSFREFLKLKNIAYDAKDMPAAKKAEIKNAFDEYMRKGGFPEYLKTEENEYLKALYESILYRDILVRYNITNEKTFKEIVSFIAGNISKEISFNSIRKMLNIGSPTTVKEYFNYMENSFLTFIIPQFDYSLKKQIYSHKKMYLIDNGLAVYLGYRTSKDEGRLFENLIFLELKRTGFTLFFHRDKKECDFITLKNNKIEFAVQTCTELNAENKEREIEGLSEAMRKYKLKEGILLTIDQSDEMQINKKKIRVVPAWKWLLGLDA